jgi:hypothetical protein
LDFSLRPSHPCRYGFSFWSEHFVSSAVNGKLDIAG